MQNEWKIIEDGSLCKIFQFKGHLKTMAFANAVAYLANKHNHHPEMIITFNTCTIKLITHDEGNQITAKDYNLAKEIDLL